MANQKLGDIVADSMFDILESDEHKNLFSKEAKQKAPSKEDAKKTTKGCCPCKGKCAKKCPCVKNGKCKKGCAGCTVAKKADKACCECGEKCSDSCNCKGKCAEDCAKCGDGMMADDGFVSAAEDRATLLRSIIASLNTVCEYQEVLGLDKSASQTVAVIETVLAEAEEQLLGKKKVATPVDENDVTSGDILSGKPGLFDDGLSILEDEGIEDEQSTMAWLKFKKEHPDEAAQMASRQYAPLPNEINELVVDWDNETQADTDIDDLLQGSEWKPPATIGNEEQAWHEKQKQLFRGKDFGHHGVDNPDDYALTPEERDTLAKAEIAREDEYQNNHVEAFQKLDEFLKKHAEDDDYEFSDAVSNLLQDSSDEELYDDPESLDLDKADPEDLEELSGLSSGINYDAVPGDFRVRENDDWVEHKDLPLLRQLELEHSGLQERDHDLDPDDLSYEALESSEQEWED